LNAADKNLFTKLRMERICEYIKIFGGLQISGKGITWKAAYNP
jgi:hypothetical protein